MKYNRYVVSRIGKCVLNRAECVGLIVQFVAEHASDPEMAAIMAQLLEVGYSYSYDEDSMASTPTLRSSTSETMMPALTTATSACG